MLRKNLTLIFKNFEEEHLGKDVFMVPYYLGKINNMQVTIVCPKTETNVKLGNDINGVKIERIPFKKPSNRNTFYYSCGIISYLIKNARKIDTLICFHVYDPVIFMATAYKLLNPKGCIYNKADGGLSMFDYKFGLISKKIIYNYFLRIIDYISFESKDKFHKIISLHPQYRNKIKLIPNGFDEDRLLQARDIKIKSFREKENLIITVARIGSIVKNTDLFLEALSNLDLKDWKVLLIGPIEQKEQDFQKKIDLFYKENPKLKDSVIFTGPIYDKNKLWHYYNTAKIFVLTSKSEGFANVFCEAYRFSNYIISTDVGGARDSISNGYGSIFNDSKDLTAQLQSIIDQKNNLEIMLEQSSKKDISWETLLKKIRIN